MHNHRPALDAAMSIRLHFGRLWRRARGPDISQAWKRI